MVKSYLLYFECGPVFMSSRRSRVSSYAEKVCFLMCSWFSFSLALSVFKTFLLQICLKWHNVVSVVYFCLFYERFWFNQVKRRQTVSSTRRQIIKYSLSSIDSRDIQESFRNVPQFCVIASWLVDSRRVYSNKEFCQKWNVNNPLPLFTNVDFSTLNAFIILSFSVW